jgi:kynureninase
MTDQSLSFQFPSTIVILQALEKQGCIGDDRKQDGK